MQDVKRIETYSLYEFCQEVELALKAGFSFDFDSNENFPQNYGTLLTCGLVKVGKKVEAEEVVTDGAKVEETEETDAQTEQVTKSATVTEQTEEVVQNTEQVESTETTSEETETEEVVEGQENAEATPAKRGPKPKNK